ncbi:major capsid protein [Elephant endotheliotropic herpesvirus 3A]|uniref:Major capsid protein n=1 Tax=Elephant endotheliotropic herpesvirus 3A TaxID=1329409 RepID=A0A866VSX2_9BETA|nr:major capsid protein [Elephant endotheliotropic herpesvirus 3A]QOE74448.1 major capsid protein [Elephant endotheliotropic herpesvirus 3A]
MERGVIDTQTRTTTELLNKYPLHVNIAAMIRNHTAGELFDNLRLFFGATPENYNLQFEAIFGVYCNRLEWIHFLGTALGATSHVVRFPDIEKLSLGKVLFHVTIPRVAVPSGVPNTKNATAVVVKYTERTPIGISFELSMAALEKLRISFQDATLLDKVINIQAINSTLQCVANSANALQRGLINVVVTKLLRKAPPLPILKYLEEPTGGWNTNNLVNRSNAVFSIKTYLAQCMFILNRSDSKTAILNMLTELTTLVKSSIMMSSNLYRTSSGEDIGGVLVTTGNVLNILVNMFAALIRKDSVLAPVAYGEFLLSKENAVTAIAHHAILADFDQYVRNVETLNPGMLKKSNFLHLDQSTTHLQFQVMHLGETLVALEHIDRVYKDTVTHNPLDNRVELTFFSVLGLHLPKQIGYSTMDNKLTMNATVQNNAPTALYFYDKDFTLQKLEFSDCLRTLCHPIFHDSQVPVRIFTRDIKDGERLCDGHQYVVENDPPFPTDNNSRNFYADPPPQRSTNQIKSEYVDMEFYKPDNKCLYTELHPMYDFSDVTIEETIAQIVTPRVVTGNLPPALAPGEFHETRALEIMELSRNVYPSGYENTVAVLTNTVNDPEYPEIFYLISVLVHGNRDAFMAARNTITACINAAFNAKGILPFVHDFDMIRLIVHHMTDSGIMSEAHTHYKKLWYLLGLIRRVVEYGATHGTLLDDPMASYLNALFDKRLLPPIVHAFPLMKPETGVKVNNRLTNVRNADGRNYGVSNLDRIIDLAGNTLYRDEATEPEEITVASKIYYYCVLPAVANNHLCGASMLLHLLIPDGFFNDDFVQTEQLYVAEERFDGSPLLRRLFSQAGIVFAPGMDVNGLMTGLFRLIYRMPENARVLEIFGSLDPAQKAGMPGFHSIHHALYDGFILLAPPVLLEPYIRAVPFHRFYADPNIAQSCEHYMREFLTNNPQCNTVNGDFPLHPYFEREYFNWHRSPFTRYAATCLNNIKSMLALACMHTKFSPVSMYLQAKARIHPGFAMTAVRTDLFDVERILYGTKSSLAVIIGDPSVFKEKTDIHTTYHITQDISTLDMGMGFSAVTCPAYMRRVLSDMGANPQDMFKVFPVATFGNDVLDGWVRTHTGGTHASLFDPGTIDMLTFGQININEQPGILIGQKAVMEFIPTPVTSPLPYYRIPNNPRGRASCTLAVDPEKKPDLFKILYDHGLPDSQTFLSTANPWASQWGSLGDIMYNQFHREHIGYNSKIYSPCKQFFTLDEITIANRTLHKIASEYNSRSKTCIDGDNETQYVCVDGTNELTEKPCTIFQEAYPILAASSEGLLESHLKTPGLQSAETHFQNYLIEEVIPVTHILRK